MARPLYSPGDRMLGARTIDGKRGGVTLTAPRSGALTLRKSWSANAIVEDLSQPLGGLAVGRRNLVDRL
jgi:hypothetical protein